MQSNNEASVSHLPAVGEALCSLARISLSEWEEKKKNHNKQTNPDLIKGKQGAGESRSNGGEEGPNVTEYLCFHSSLLWRWSLHRKRTKEWKNKNIHTCIMRKMLEGGGGHKSTTLLLKLTVDSIIFACEFWGGIGARTS